MLADNQKYILPKAVILTVMTIKGIVSGRKKGRDNTRRSKEEMEKKRSGRSEEIDKKLKDKVSK